jgi:hypothetical protein
LYRHLPRFDLEARDPIVHDQVLIKETVIEACAHSLLGRHGATGRQGDSGEEDSFDTSVHD